MEIAIELDSLRSILKAKLYVDPFYKNTNMHILLK